MRQKKLPLVIHIDDWGMVVLNKSRNPEVAADGSVRRRKSTTNRWRKLPRAVAVQSRRFLGHSRAVTA